MEGSMQLAANRAAQILWSLVLGRNYEGADNESQRAILSILSKGSLTVPVLTEERVSDSEWPDITVICGDDKITDLPPQLVVVDPLDGSAIFESGCPEFGLSIAHLEGGQPESAQIRMPMLSISISVLRGGGCLCNSAPVLYKTVQRPLSESLVGLDIGPSVNDATFSQVIQPLTRAFRYVRNLPSVASGVEVLLGRTLAWVSTNACIWDVAGSALAIQEWGGVAECLDGNPIPWNRVRMPPLLFAASAEVAQSVRNVCVLPL